MNPYTAATISTEQLGGANSKKTISDARATNNSSDNASDNASDNNSNSDSDNITIPIEYLHPSDEILMESFKNDMMSDIQRYISNANSEQMNNYNKYHTLIYSKYAGKKYTIKSSEHHITVYNTPRATVHTLTPKILESKKLIHIHKPHFIRISTSLTHYKHLIAVTRSKLLIQYNSLDRTNIAPSEKSQLQQLHAELLSLLCKYYTYLLFQTTMNSSSGTSGATSSIITAINEREYIPKHGIGDSLVWTPIINTILIPVSSEYLTLKNATESHNLNLYNELMTLDLTEKQHEHKIKTYLEPSSTTPNTTIPHLIHHDLIITKLPIINH